MPIDSSDKNNNSVPPLVQQMHEDLQDGKLSKVIQDAESFVRDDKNGTFLSEMKNLLQLCLDESGPLDTSKILMYGIIPGARKSEVYRGMAAEMLVSLSVHDDLEPLYQFNSAYTALKNLKKDTPAWEASVDRIYELCETDPGLDHVKAYEIIREILVDKPPQSSLINKGISLWQEFMTAASSRKKPIDEIIEFAQDIGSDHPATEKALSLWESELDRLREREEYHIGLTAMIYALTEKYTPEIFVEKTVDHWKKWRGTQDGLDPKDKVQARFLHSTLTMIKKLYDRDNRQYKKPGTKRAIADLKTFMSRDIVDQYPFEGSNWGEAALLQAARYDGKDRELRRDIIKNLKDIVQSSSSLQHVRSMALYHHNRHLDFLGLSGPGNRNGPSRNNPSF